MGCTERCVPAAGRSGRGQRPIERGGIKYDRALKRYRDTYNAMTGAEQKGRAEGIEQNKLDTARKLKSMNVMTDEQIAEATGLTPETVSNL